jgi:flavin-dependent dehydrogenase
VLVAGDAAGLLEPWTREGISYALRSGTLAGRAAASGDLPGYATAIEQVLGPSMRAGRRLLAAYSRHPSIFHAVLASPPAYRWFARFCRGEAGFDEIVRYAPVRAALAALSR